MQTVNKKSQISKILHFFLLDLISGKSCNALESFLNSCIILRRGLEEFMISIILGPQLSFGLSDFSLLFLIGLVSDDHEGELARVLDPTLLDKLLLPGFDAVERLLGGDVIDDHAAVGASVEGGPDGLESFLSSCIPDLQTVVLTVVGNVGGEEVSSDSGSVLGSVFTGHVPVHQGGFSDTKLG